MASDVVNLRQFRKRKSRDEKQKTAEQNRVSFGRTKTEKNLTHALNVKALSDHEKGRREQKPETPDTQD